MKLSNETRDVLKNFASINSNIVFNGGNEIKTMSEAIKPPIDRKIRTYINPFAKFPIDKNVTVIAITIPIIPNKFPCLDVSGDDKPLRAKINNTPEIK